jgi:catechol 2,3-dioxygenase-like lactoylglutathione lyase family enzyme
LFKFELVALFDIEVHDSKSYLQVKVNEMTDSSPSTLPWQDMHHIALATGNIEETIRFYTEVVGMQAADIQPPNPIHGRTCTIRPGIGAKVELHFFEDTDAAPLPSHPEILQRLMFPYIGVHHLAFLLPDAEAGQQLYARLNAQEILTTPVMDQGGLYNFLFQDNNGLVLEANWLTA